MLNPSLLISFVPNPSVHDIILLFDDISCVNSDRIASYCIFGLFSFSVLLSYPCARGYPLPGYAEFIMLVIQGIGACSYSHVKKFLY